MAAVNKRITGRQCRQARGLLKWNQRDLLKHAGTLQLRRLNSFEQGAIQLYKGEMDEVVKAFTNHNIEFTANFDVKLTKKVKRAVLQQFSTEERRYDATEQFEEEVDTRLKSEEEERRKREFAKRKKELQE